MKTQGRGGFASILVLAVMGIGLSAGLVMLSRIQASSDPLFEAPKLLTHSGSRALDHLPISTESYASNPQSTVDILRPSLVFVVNSPLDGTDSNPGDGVCETGSGNGICTLRAAIQESNISPGDDTIEIRPGLYQLTLSGADEDGANTGDLDIFDSVRVVGAGATSTIIDGGKIDRVFHIIGPFNVTISGLTIRNGMTIPGEDGGGIFNSSTANTIISRSILENNVADMWGGAIANDENAQIDIQETLIQGNRAGMSGGGIDNHRGSMTLIDSQVFSNTATNLSGGGIYNDGTLRIENALLAYNSAGLNGGGIFNFDSLIVERSAVTNNSAGRDGGGIYNAVSSELDIRNVTVSGNHADRNGGGIHNLSSSMPTDIRQMEAFHLTIVDNSANGSGGGLYQDGFATLYNSIIANNGVNCALLNGIDTRGNNLEDQDSCGLSNGGDLPNTAPLLGILQPNGSDTPTHEPLLNSPAVDAADSSSCLTVDQRGVPRPQGLGCDIGAHEVNFDDLAIAKNGFPNPVFAGQPLSYEISVSNFGSSDAINVRIVDTLPLGTIYLGAVGSGWVCTEASGIVTCEISQVEKRTTKSLILEAQAPNVAGVITNTATVTSTMQDSIPSNDQTFAQTTVIANADLALSVFGNPATIQVGEPLSFTLSVLNKGPSRSEVITVTIDMPLSQISYQGAEGVGWSCGMDVTQLVCTLPQLVSGVNASAVITVLPLAGDIIVQVPVRVSAVTADLVANNNSGFALLGNTILKRADLAVQVSALPDPVMAGNVLTYTVDVRNLGPHVAQIVTVTHQLPALVSVQSMGGNGWMCSETNGLVTCVRSDVVLGLAPPLIISVIAPIEPTRLTATTTVRSSIQDPQLNNNTQVTQSRMTGVADLALTMIDLPDPVALGSRLAYIVTVANLGPSTATSIVFSMTLPGSVFYLNAHGDNWDCGADQRIVTCRQPSLLAGELSVIRVEVNTANVSLNETLVTAGSVGSDTFDPELANNSASQTTTAGVTDLTVQLQSEKKYLLSGTQVVYRVVVENKGPDIAAPVTVTVQLPAQVQFVEAGAVGWTCDEDGTGLVTCTIPTLGVGTHVLPVSATIVVDNTVAIATAIIATDTFDQDMTNNQDALALPPVYRQFLPVLNKGAPRSQ